MEACNKGTDNKQIRYKKVSESQRLFSNLVIGTQGSSLP